MKSNTIYRNGNSKSYNAECAEEEFRYPLTKAAKYFGITSKLFKEALIHINYVSTEWHHVSKFANKVDYYDTVELSDNARFWLYLSKKSKKNSKLFYKNASKARFQDLLQKLTGLIILNKKNKSNFETALINRCQQLNIPYSALFNALEKDQSLQGKTVVVKNGNYYQDRYDLTHWGHTVYKGRELTSNCKHIIPFNLTEHNIRNIFSLRKLQKDRSIISYKYYQLNCKLFINKAWILKGIDNLKKGTHFTNHNSGVGASDASHKLMKILVNKFTIQKQKAA